MALWRNLEPVANGTEKLYNRNVILHCRQRRYERSLVLAAAQWTLRDVGNCAMMSVSMLGSVEIRWRLFKENGETQFSLWKSLHKCHLSLRRNESHFHNVEFVSESPNKFSENLRSSLFNKAFRMNLSSTGSISLDSTYFNYCKYFYMYKIGWQWITPCRKYEGVKLHSGIAQDKRSQCPHCAGMHCLLLPLFQTLLLRPLLPLFQSLPLHLFLLVRQETLHIRIIESGVWLAGNSCILISLVWHHQDRIYVKEIPGTAPSS